jgi:hypothetical protein
MNTLSINIRKRGSMLHTLPNLFIIILIEKTAYIFWIAKWGFGGGPILQNSKESRSDDIKL